VFLITFNTGHALPLVGTRILRPRTGRGWNAEYPREGIIPWSRHWLDHVIGMAMDRIRPRPVRAVESVMSRIRPRPLSCPRAVRGQAIAKSGTVRIQAIPRNGIRALTIRDHGLYATRGAQCPLATRALDSFRNRPRRRLIVTFILSVRFPIHIQSISSHVII
jgi:hypothetical protein